MAAKKWTVTDHGTNTNTDVTITPSDVGGGAKGYKITKKTLNSGLSQGVDIIHVDNGTFSFDILPTRGMSLWKAWLGKEEIGWKSPTRGPVHPAFVDMGEPGGLGWLDGFDELMVRCGLESNGAPEHDPKTNQLIWPLHGRIGNKPAHSVEIGVNGDTGEITVTGVVEETRFHFFKVRMTATYKTKVGEPGLSIHDEIENISASPCEIQVLYHLNIGQPLLDAGSQFVAPIKELVPRNDHAAKGIKSWNNYSGEEAGFEEQVYFMTLLGGDDGVTQTLLKNAHSTKGISTFYNTKQLKAYSVWKNTTAVADGFVTGLEPATNYPNPRTYEGKQGRVHKLAGGGKTNYDLRIEVHGNAGAVTKAENAIKKLQSQAAPKIHDKPQKGWCSDVG